jgi:hypothetical protein
MAGELDKLRDTLDRLQAQVDELRAGDPAAAAQLQTTLAEAKAVLGGQPTQAQQHSSIVQRLSDVVLKYEASHPALAGSLGRIIDALAEIGI